MDLYGVLRHLVLYGPARNEHEAAELLGALDNAAGEAATKAEAASLANLLKKENTP